MLHNNWTDASEGIDINKLMIHENVRFVIADNGSHNLFEKLCFIVNQFIVNIRISEINVIKKVFIIWITLL